MDGVFSPGSVPRASELSMKGPQSMFNSHPIRFSTAVLISALCVNSASAGDDPFADIVGRITPALAQPRAMSILSPLSDHPNA